MSPSITSTQKRRDFIAQELETHRQVSFAQIRERFPDTERASFHRDVTIMRKSGIPVTIVGPKKDRKIISESGRKFTKKAYREESQTKEKANIAEVVATLIFGNQTVKKCAAIDQLEDGARFVSYEITKTQITDSIRKWGSGNKEQHHFQEVLSKLHLYWNCHDKTIALDSGTTTDHIAEKIRHFDMVNDLDGLNNLTLFTNSRSIYFKTGAPECSIKTIIIGGKQRHQTESICGELARRCLTSWDVAFGMTIVGATGIDTTTSIMGSYNDEESAMKQELLSRAKIRVIVADSTKFGRHSFQIISKFAKIHPSSIDLLVIDSEPSSEAMRPLVAAGEKTSGADYKPDVEAWRNRMPVPVLIADELLREARKNSRPT